MRAVRLGLLTLLAVLVLTPAASALDIEEDFQPPDGEVGTPYEFEFEADGGCLPRRFSYSSGIVPPGLRITQEGLLTGTPTEAGRFDFYVAVDSACAGDLQSQGFFHMKVLPDLAVATTSVPRATPGQPYTTTLAVSGVEQGWSVSWLVVSGSFPPGLTLSPAGVISGTPTTPGKWAAVVRVQEQFRRSGEQELTFVVAAPLSLTGPSPQVGEVGLPFSAALAPAGGLAPLTFSVGPGTLPEGLALDPTTGQIQGTPVAAGAFPVQLAVKDSGGQEAKVDATLVVAAKLAVSTTTLRKAKAGKRYAAKLAANGGIRPVTWRLVGGKLPKGLKLTKTGRIVGKPRVAGRSRFTVQASDGLGGRAKRSLSLTVTK